MGWVHNTGYAPAYGHEGWAETVADPDGAGLAGWRTACSCGWRAAEPWWWSQYPTLNLAEGSAGEAMVRAEWLTHVYRVLPELELHDLLSDPAADPVAAAVRAARAGGASWADIGAAAGTSRQAAHERWRHLEPGPDDLPGALPEPGSGVDHRRLLLSELLNRDPEEVDPRAASDWAAAYKAYLDQALRADLGAGEAHAEGLDDGYAQGAAEARSQHEARPPAVLELLHAVERLAEQWRTDRREELWHAVLQAAHAAWEATDKDTPTT